MVGEGLAEGLAEGLTEGLDKLGGGWREDGVKEEQGWWKESRHVASGHALIFSPSSSLCLVFELP